MSDSKEQASNVGTSEEFTEGMNDLLREISELKEHMRLERIRNIDSDSKLPVIVVVFQCSMAAFQ